MNKIGFAFEVRHCTALNLPIEKRRERMIHTDFRKGLDEAISRLAKSSPNHVRHVQEQIRDSGFFENINVLRTTWLGEALFEGYSDTHSGYVQLRITADVEIIG